MNNQTTTLGDRPANENARPAGERIERSGNVLGDACNSIAPTPTVHSYGAPSWHAADDFRSAIVSSGLGDPGPIVADGEIHRFRCADDKAGSRNGWYVLHLDGTPAGGYGSWRRGDTSTWCSVSRDRQTPEQRADIHRMVERTRAQREADTCTRHAHAAERAQAMVDHSTEADPAHPYLILKQIGAHGARQQGIALLVPVYVDQRIASVQTIMPSGTKRFLAGGRIAGGYSLLDDATKRQEVLLSEGFATGATLHEEVGAAVYVAFNAGNLAAVARYVRARHPSADIIIAADNDAWTEGNPGLTKAKAAAIDIGAKLLVPDFTGMDTSGKPTDWNDWYRLGRVAGGGK